MEYIIYLFFLKYLKNIFLSHYYLKILVLINKKINMGIGDWGLGIGDWAQSPIPNPQSPIPNPHIYLYLFKYISYYFNINSKNKFKKYEQ